MTMLMSIGTWTEEASQKNKESCKESLPLLSTPMTFPGTDKLCCLPLNEYGGVVPGAAVMPYDS